jgi:hypothetical protein
MKRSPVLFALALAAAPALHAQEPAPANPARLQLAPAAAPSTPAPDGGPEVTLIPEQVPQNAKPTATPKPKPEVKDKTEESAEELLERIHFREAMTKALRDPQVQAEWDHSKKVKTDYDRPYPEDRCLGEKDFRSPAGSGAAPARADAHRPHATAEAAVAASRQPPLWAKKRVEARGRAR